MVKGINDFKTDLNQKAKKITKKSRAENFLTRNTRGTRASEAQQKRLFQVKGFVKLQLTVMIHFQFINKSLFETILPLYLV